MVHSEIARRRPRREDPPRRPCCANQRRGPPQRRRHHLRGIRRPPHFRGQQQRAGGAPLKECPAFHRPLIIRRRAEPRQELSSWGALTEDPPMPRALPTHLRLIGFALL